MPVCRSGALRLLPHGACASVLAVLLAASGQLWALEPAAHGECASPRWTKALLMAVCVLALGVAPHLPLAATHQCFVRSSLAGSLEGCRATGGFLKLADRLVVLLDDRPHNGTETEQPRKRRQ